MSVSRARSPSRPSWWVSPKAHGSAFLRVRSGACSPAPHRHDVTGVGRVGFDLGAQPTDVDVDQATVAEVTVAPDPFEEDLAAEHPTRARRQLDEQAELGLGEVHLVAVAQHHALVGDDLEVAELEVGDGRIGGAGPPQQGPDAGRELLGGERLGEVVVGAGLEPGHHVVGVGPGGDHDDRDVAVAADRPADLEAVDAREHDVDQHDVGGVAVERVEGVLAVVGLLDGPALVLEGHLDRGADAFVVFDGQDAGTHRPIVPDRGPEMADTRQMSVESRQASSRAPVGVGSSSARRAGSSSAGGAATTDEAGRRAAVRGRCTTAPASRAISAPAAMSHGARPSS